MVHCHPSLKEMGAQRKHLKVIDIFSEPALRFSRESQRIHKYNHVYNATVAKSQRYQSLRILKAAPGITIIAPEVLSIPVPHHAYPLPVLRHYLTSALSGNVRRPRKQKPANATMMINIVTWTKYRVGNKPLGISLCFLYHPCHDAPCPFKVQNAHKVVFVQHFVALSGWIPNHSLL